MNHSLLQRNPAMDVIRCVALFSVISVHFFLNTGFYNSLFVGVRMYFATMIRMASMVCVPLFLLLSGYLMKNKRATGSYYSKLIRTVSLYIIASFCCWLYRTRLNESIFSFCLETLNYTAAPYSWYMEMYFGLFLMIPYLNVLYNGLPGERSRRGLILTMLIVTAFTEISNCFLYTPETGWQLSADPERCQTILPNWWQGIYPITYYFLGAYLKDHPLRLSKKVNILLLLLTYIINGTANFVIYYGEICFFGSWQSWGSLPNVIQTVLLFSLLAGMEYQSLSGKSRWLLSRISELSLSAYLLSWIFDQLVYSALNRYVFGMGHRFLWYPITTLLVFTGSLCLAWVVETVYQLIANVFSRLFLRKNTV